MKLSLLLIPLLFFMTSCTIDWNDEKDAKIAELDGKITKLENLSNSGSEKKKVQFSNSELGIRFDSFYNYEGETFRIDGNRIIWQMPTDTDYSISVYHTEAGESPENAIKRLIANTGKDPEKCEIIYDGYFTPGNKGYKVYKVRLKDKNISYTKDEEKLIEADKARAQGDGRPVFADIEIYNNKVIETCSDFAAPAPPATFKTIGAFFIYNNSRTLVFHTPLGDPSFIDFDTLEITDPKD